MLLDSPQAATHERSVSEINALIPRRVQISPDQPKLLLWSLLAFLVAAAIWFGFYSYYSRQVLQREALRSVGTQLIAEITRLPSSKSHTYVRYSFRIGPRWYGGEAALPDRRIEVKVGQPIAIRYLPTDPSINHPSDWEWSLGSDIVPFVAFLLASGLGFVPAIVFPVTLIRVRTLARRGLVVEGKVTACAPNHSKFNIDYEFRTNENILVEGTNEYSDEEYELGSSVRIIYLRSHPKRNACYPLSAFRISEP